MNTRINVIIPEQLFNRTNELIRKGLFSNFSEVVREGLRKEIMLYRETEDEKLFALIQKASKKGKLLSEEDMKKHGLEV